MSDVYRSGRWRMLRRAVLSREGTCRVCSRRPATELDHVVPLRWGGDPFEMDNVQPVCGRCHMAKTALEHMPGQGRAGARWWRADKDDRAVRRARGAPTYAEARAGHEAMARWAAARKHDNC